MKRIVFHAPDDMYEAIERMAQKRRAPLSAILREACEEYLSARGVDVDGRVTWGKPADGSDDKASVPGQTMAGATVIA
jgi:predicted transcriptional regulator